MEEEKKVIWSDDTISHFTFQASYCEPTAVFEAIKRSIEVGVVLKDGESEESLALDLFDIVYNN